jgi:hypothetical protein
MEWKSHCSCDDLQVAGAEDRPLRDGVLRLDLLPPASAYASRAPNQHSRQKLTQTLPDHVGSSFWHAQKRLSSPPPWHPVRHSNSGVGTKRLAQKWDNRV